MNHYIKIFLMSLLFACIYGQAYAQQKPSKYSWSADYLTGEGGADGIKLASQYHSDWLKKYSEKWELYFEGSINYWKDNEDTDSESVFVIAFSPVFMYPLFDVGQTPIYIELGIGVSLLSEDQFAGKDIGSHYQFEDRIGFAAKFGENNNQKIALRYFHYSNAGINEPNPGLDFFALSYSTAF